MAYTPKTDWQYNEIVTESDLNRIEQGIADADTTATAAHSTANAALPKAGGTMTGPLVIPVNAAGQNVPAATLADLIYYVRTDGSDSNNGLSNTSGGAFATIAKAKSVIPQIVNHNVDITVGAGTYSEPIDLRGFTGSGRIRILGAAGASSIVTYVFLNNQMAFTVIDNITASGLFTNLAAFTVQNAIRVNISNCVSTLSNASAVGVVFNGAMGYVTGCTLSNKSAGIYVNSNGAVTSDTNTGTGNSYGLLAEAGIVFKKGTQPTGTVFDDFVNGGIITSGVKNPWGDNTLPARSGSEAYNDASQSVGAGPAIKVLYGALSYDRLSEYDTANSRFTSRNGGLYLIMGLFGYQSLSSAATLSLFVYLNGNSATSYLVSTTVLPTGVAGAVPYSFEISLAPGDYAEIYAVTSVTITRTLYSTLSFVRIA